MKSRRLILKLATCAIALLLSLLAAELFVRIFFPQHPSWLDIFATNDSTTYGLQANVTRIISTGESTWTIHTDADGFRCGASPVRDMRPELLILGDSFTFGMGVDYERSIPGCLDAALPDLHVINTGVPGYGPAQYRQVLQHELEKGAPIKGVIVITFLGNDFHDCLAKKGNVRDGLLGNEQTLRSVLKRNSHLYRLTASVYHHLPSNELEYRPHEWELYHAEQWDTGALKDALPIYQAEMARIHELCEAQHVRLLACIIPSPHAVQIADGSAKPAPGEQFDLPARLAKSIFDAAAINYRDATPDLAKATMARTYFGWDEHLNPTGNHLVADTIVAAWSQAAH